MTVPDELMSLLRCIECHSELDEVEAQLVCRSCGTRYPVDDGIPVMIPEAAIPPEGS